MYLRQTCCFCRDRVDWFVTIGDEIADKPGLTEAELGRVEVEVAYTACGHVQTLGAEAAAREDAIDELRGLIERRRENPLLMYSDIKREWENSLTALTAVRRGLEVGR